MYKIIDLFAGAGGFSHGFKMAGFETDFAVEIDKSAAETYEYNNPNTKVLNQNIKEIINLSSLTKNKITGIIGGPPCQGFSLSGNRDPKDPRNSLFIEYLRFVKHFKPHFFIMENVPGLLSMKTSNKKKVINIIEEEFVKVGYDVNYKILNSADFGVPQIRKRVFIIGIDSSLKINPESFFPKPLMSYDNYITLEEAIMDLPHIEAKEGEELMEYTMNPISQFQLMMRENSFQVHNHQAMKHTKRLIDRFSQIGHGQSVAHVSQEFAQRKRGNPKKISGKTYSQNNMRPYPNKPSPTIAASFQSNFIHPFINRNFTAREGARIQSFPDTYVFKGKRTTMSWEKNLSQYQQIGNAVPPLLAKAIADNIKKILDKL